MTLITYNFSTMVECGMCHENYEEVGAKIPKLLPCGHSLCLSCLRKDSNCGYVKCLFCKISQVIPNGYIENFPTNRQTIKALENNMKIYTVPSSGEALEIDYHVTENFQQDGNSFSFGGAQQQRCHDQGNASILESSLNERHVMNHSDTGTNDIREHGTVGSARNEHDRDPWYLRQFNMYQSHDTETPPTIQENDINVNPRRRWNCHCFITSILLFISLVLFIYGARELLK